MRWMSALLLCGCLALVAAVAFQSPQSLAMQNGTPTPPSGVAAAFCPDDQKVPPDELSILDPQEETVGAVPVTNIANPDPAAADSGKLVLTFVTLQPHSCILGSIFYPSMIMTVRSGTIDILVEHWPGLAAAPEALRIPNGTIMPQAFAVNETVTLAAGDWVQVTNESFVGFRNISDAEATFTVAGLKPDGDPGGGGCGGGCRKQP